MGCKAFVAEVKKLIERQKTTAYVALALEELNLKYVEDVISRSFFLGRCLALQEENQ